MDMIGRLIQLGWSLTGPDQLAELQKLYAAFHGLSSVSDVPGHLALPRFCNHPDVMPLTSGVCKWPDGEITWDVIQPLPAFQLARFVELVTEAFARWARVAGIRPHYTPGNPQARIVITHRAIDGPYGVLAESELPCGGVAQCRQWYDDSEQWSAFDGPPTGPNALDVVRVMTHELGHALGMNHIGAGNLLAPTYDNNISTPQAGDIKEMVARYGPPLPPPPPPPPPPPGGGDPGADFVIRVTGGQVTIDGYRVTKLMGM